MAPGKNRVGISEIQKKSLRSWFQSQQPRPSHSVCVDWFEETFSRRINQSTVSAILSKRYDHLDHGPASALQRQQLPQWPILEERISDWIIASQAAGEHRNGEDIIRKAREIWPQIQEYGSMPTPSFSQGWLSKFKKRHGARQSSAHDGDPPAPPMDFRKEIKGLRSRCGEFPDQDIYNMDETGLLWRKAPYEAIPPFGTPPVYRERSRVCLAVCTNSTGSDRLPLWIIGHKEKPEALRQVNLEAMECNWRHDRKAWMTTEIMSEWLLFFYRHVGERRVLLLLDNFAAHEAALQITPPPAHVHIHVFPAYATAQHQPMGLGITQHLKHHFRKQWLSYIVAGTRSASRPIEKMTLFHAICWITRNWRHDIPHSVIYKAFRRTTLLDPQIEYLYAPKPPDLTELYNEVIRNKENHIPAIDYETYLNPVEEDIVESGEIAWFDTFSATEILDEPVTPLPQDVFIPSTVDAIAGIQTAIRFMLHQSIASPKEIQEMERLERFFTRKSQAPAPDIQN
ncbi:transcriptional regulator family: Centromere protein B DNA-binding region [Penicillium capsulatum]|uniref:Transcriptional regulator family: Centromere protein B DNA-binding region n=1 Tax=Penicillium capsulatum TaxID=69766 RepID=A0A9W9IMY6_9EURO|nr:transcriptional regulator family: Centromere protein B DNA-binding region [Penicillium capsulatum]